MSAQTEASSLEFIENKGQWDSRALLKADVGTGSLFFHKKGIKVVLHDPREIAEMAASHAGQFSQDSGASAGARRNMSGRPMIRTHAYSVDFLDMNENVEIVPDKPLDTYNNYFIGNDPAQWHTNIPTFARVRYAEVYPGIDLVYYGKQ